MKDSTENDGPSAAASRKVGARLHVGCSSVVGFVVAWIIMSVAVNLCFGSRDSPPFWTFFVALFVASAAGFLWSRRTWRRIKSGRAFYPIQFTLRGLLAGIGASAMLLGLLQWFEATPGQWGAVITFFGIVWIAARLLFRGRRPWLASVLVGAALGLFLGLVAWIEALDHAAWRGEGASSAELVRDLFLAVGMSVALAVMANLLLTCNLWVVAFIGLLFPGPETAEARPAKTDDPSEGEPRPDCSGETRRGVILRAAAALLLLAGVAIIQRPIRIWYYRNAAEYYSQQAYSREGPSPLEGFLLLLRDMSYDIHGSVCLELYEECRDKLVDLGYLTHRVFVFEHIQTGTGDGKSSDVFRLTMERFPDNIHTTGSWSDKPKPFRLEVWDRPGKIPEWEAFVQEVDRPDFPENIAP